MCRHDGQALCECGRSYCSVCCQSGQCPSCEGYDQVSDAEFLRIAVGVVGMNRLLALMGWALFWTATGHGDTRSLRLRIQDAGVSRRAAYVALSELKQIGEAVRTREGRAVDGCDPGEVLPRMARMNIPVQEMPRVSS